MKQLNSITRIWLLVLAMTFAGIAATAQNTVGPFTYYPTNQGGTMQGQAQIDGLPAVTGDIIAAFDPSDECVGAALLTINSGTAYINFVIYGDDGGGHGMSSGEDFFLKVYDDSSGDIIEYGTGLSGWSNTNFAPMPGYNNVSTVYNFETAVVVTPPTVTTAAVTGIDALTATCGGEVTDDGGAAVEARGVCWNTTGNPTTANAHTTDGTGTGTFTSSLTGLMPNTPYYVRAYATNSEGTAYGNSETFTTLELDQYFTPVWTTPFQPMNIYVLKATIDEQNMVAGDEIGIFDIDPDSGEEICVGAGILDEELTGTNFLVITASMDDGTSATNGFQNGNEIIYKLWSPAAGEVDMVTAIYPYPGYDENFTLLGSGYVELDGITVKTQDINMVSGWNLVSFRVIPDNLDMADIFDPLIQNESLVKVIDQDGGSLEHIPIPPPNGQWNNGIGNLTMEQGYYCKVNQASTLTVIYPPVETPLTIPLRMGWNMISVPCETPQDAQTILQDMIDNETLIKAINDAGQAIEHLPVPPPNGQWYFGFESFESSEGYYIKASEATSITFNCDAPYTGDGVPEKQLTSHFTTVWENNPYMPMSIALTGIDQLPAGSEIGIFDGEVCVGASVVDGSDLISIPVSMDDPSTEIQDGFISGNEITAFVYDARQGTEIPATLEYQSGVAEFSALESYFGNLSYLMTGMNDDYISGYAIRIMPNPADDQTQIYYQMPENGEIQLALYDISGIKVRQESHDANLDGQGNIRLITSGLERGCYILQFTYHKADQVITVHEKLIIK